MNPTEEMSMKRLVPMAVPAVLCVSLFMAGSPAALAQAKPKKAEAAGTQKTISGGAMKGNALSFKEFEACMNEQDALKARTPELQKQRDALEAERKPIQQEGQAIKAEAEVLGRFGERVKAFNARLSEQGAKVKAWKEREEAFVAANRSGPGADRQRKDLEAERQELQKGETALDQQAKALQTERDQLGVEKFNAHATEQERAATDWNARSKALDQAFQAYEDDRGDWKSRCANRPYREEWEKLIREGK
jgi:hypothetical protein